MSVADHHVVITAEDNREIVITAEDHQHLLQILNREFTPSADERTYLYDLLMGLHRASIVEPEEVPRDVVTMASVVELDDVETKDRKVFTLVYPDSEDASENLLSVLSPLGAALLGSRRGSLLSTTARAGEQHTLRVENIVYQPEHYER